MTEKAVGTNPEVVEDRQRIGLHPACPNMLEIQNPRALALRRKTEHPQVAFVVINKQPRVREDVRARDIHLEALWGAITDKG